MKCISAVNNFTAKINIIIEKVAFNYFIIGCMLISLTISLFSAGQSLWFDELFSAVKTDSTMSLLEVIKDASLSDTWPPLYYIILHYVQVFFGNSEFMLRLPSIIANVLVIPFTYLFVNRVYSKKEALLSSVFITFSPVVLYYSVEARGYSLFLLLSILSFYFFIRFINNIQNKFLIYMYFLFALLCTLTHYFGLMIVILQLIYFCCNKQILKQHFIKIVIFILIILIYPYIHYQVLSSKFNIFQEGSPVSVILNSQVSNVTFMTELINSFLFKILPDNIEQFILLISFFYFVFIIKENKNNKIILLFIIFPIITVLIFSLFGKLFYTKYFIFLLPLVYALVSSILLKLFPLYHYVIIIILLVCFAFNSKVMCFYKPWTPVPVRDNVIFLKENCIEENTVVFYDHETSYIEYYIKRLGIKKYSICLNDIDNLDYEIMMFFKSNKKIYYITSMNSNRDFVMSEFTRNFKCEKIYDKIYKIEKFGD